MNQYMNEMREQIFSDYRETIEKHKDLDSKYEELLMQIRAVDEARGVVRSEMNKIKDLIDIMITEDCDPVMAKLKYSETLSEKAEVAYPDQMVYSGYGNTKKVASTGTGLINRISKAIRW